MTTKRPWATPKRRRATSRGRDRTAKARAASVEVRTEAAPHYLADQGREPQATARFPDLAASVMALAGRRAQHPPLWVVGLEFRQSAAPSFTPSVCQSGGVVSGA
jgi:hypothetical protein